MPAPLITVLMPVHNGAAHLVEALQSVLDQSLEDFELLIVDDASTDDSASIVETFTDPRIRLIRSTDRLKLSGALNLGLDQAQGRYVARMDADDISHEDRLLFQARFMEEHPHVGICGTWIRYCGSANSVLKRPLTHGEIDAFTLFDTPFAHPSVFLRRELLEQHQLRFDGSYFPTEDFELWTRLLPLTQAINLPSVLLNYRVHDKSLTGADWSAMDVQAVRVIESQLRKLGLSPSEAELRFHRQLTMGRLTMTDGLLEQTEAWLLQLIQANHAANRYTQAGLSAVVAGFWAQACLHTARLGFWVTNRYARSTLAAHDPNRFQNQALMRLSALKAKLSPP